MCLIVVGWWWKCTDCGIRYFQTEDILRPPYDYKADIENYDVWAPDCNCLSNWYWWAFYSINPLYFDVHHSQTWRYRAFMRMCDDCKAAGPGNGSTLQFSIRMNANDEPSRMSLYGPGRTELPGMSLPPPLPQVGEAINPRDEEDSGSDTTLASTPRQEDQSSEHKPPKLPTFSTHPGFQPSAWHSEALPDKNNAAGRFFTDSGENMQAGHRQDERTKLEEEYVGLMQHTRRRSVNRRDDDLGLL